MSILTQWNPSGKSQGVSLMVYLGSIVSIGPFYFEGDLRNLRTGYLSQNLCLMANFEVFLILSFSNSVHLGSLVCSFIFLIHQMRLSSSKSSFVIRAFITSPASSSLSLSTLCAFISLTFLSFFFLFFFLFLSLPQLVMASAVSYHSISCFNCRSLYLFSSLISYLMGTELNSSLWKYGSIVELLVFNLTRSYIFKIKYFSNLQHNLMNCGITKCLWI